MRILYLTNGFPYPLVSGYLRHYFLIKELSQHHAITLLSITGTNFTTEHAEALAPFTERILTFNSTGKSRSIGRKALSRVQRLARPERAVRQMRAAVRQLTREEHFDLVFFSGKQIFPATKDFNNLPMVADMCDATSTRVWGRLRYANRLWLPLLLVEYLKIRSVERALMRKAELIVFASCRDRDALLDRSDNRATIVPNGVDLNFWTRSLRERGRDTIVFTGAMDYAPNTDAALYLIEEILPLVQRSVPSAKALIVGRDPTSALLKAGQKPGVTVTGFVEDVRPYLEQGTVFAAPLRFGAGIQNKVLEAMAMEVPVIASSLAADGLRTEDGRHPPVLVAETREQFAELISRQLIAWINDPRPDTRARRYVEDNFVWERCGERLEQVISDVTSAAKQ